MSDRGKFSGFNWHVEYHTTEKKKEKAADCIYLTKDRICQHKKSVNYLGKCFSASNCPLKVKENSIQTEDEKKQCNQEQKHKIKKIHCTLQKGCPMYNKRFGQGKLIEYNESSMIILVQFGEKNVRFLYPNAIIDKHLIVSEDAYKRVMRDITKAEKG